jgi:tRNA(fMet)-specific endonuclease VapC
MRYLLDTSICIEMIRGRFSEVVLKRLRRHAPRTVGISSITLAELQYGVAKSGDPGRNMVALAHVVAPLVVVSFDDVSAAAYGKLRTHLEGLGLVIGPLDMLIAAHALSLGVALATGNEREFARVPSLRVENWTRP